MKKELPIQMPISKCYQFSAYPLSIIANYDKSRGWIFTNYIQTCIHENFLTAPVPFKFYEFDYTLNPWLKVNRLDRSLFPLFRTSLTDFTINCLSEGKYVYLNLDEFFVPNRPAYQNYHMTHDVLVIGFDEEQKYFSILGYTEEHVFDKTTISFADFEVAYASLDQIENDCHQIYLYEYNKEGHYSFQPGLVAEAVEDYLLSRNTARKYGALAEPEHDLVFGLNTYPVLAAHVEHIAANPNDPIDIRLLHLLWEHKHFMTLRVKYMGELGCLKGDADGLHHSFEAIEKESLQARDMLIKYYFSKNKSLLQMINGKLEQVRQAESVQLQRLLDSIEIANSL